MANFNVLTPREGSFLVSEPFMLDANFNRSVVLLCEHNNDAGTLGFILNRPTEFVVSDFIPQLEECHFPIYYGGPLQRDSLYFIHCCHDLFPQGKEIRPNIYFGGDSEKLFDLIKEGLIQQEDVKFLMGYASWLPEQLLQEIDDNSWAVYNKFPSSLAFISEEEELWRAAIIGMGPRYAHIINFPKSPDLN